MTAPADIYTAASGQTIYGGRIAPSGGGGSSTNIMAILPTPGQLKSVHLNDLTSVNPGPGWFSESQGQNGPWSLWCGAVLASGYSTYGAAVYHGGGHGGYDGPEAYVFDLSTCMWVRSGNVPASDYHPSLDPLWCDFAFEGGFIPPATHTYGNQVYIPPALAGNAKGSFLLTTITFGDVVTGINGNRYPHALDLATGVWSRFTTNRITTGSGGYGCSFTDTTRNIVWGTTDADSAAHYKIDLNATPRTAVVAGSFYSAGWNHTTRYVASKDMAISLWCDYSGTTVHIKALDLSSGSPVEIATPVQGSVKNLAGAGFGFDYCPDTGKFYCYEGNGASILHVLTPPTDWRSSAPWTWSTETMGGETPVAMQELGGVGSGTGNGPYSKWLYNPAVKCFMWSQGTVQRLSPDGVMRNGAFQLYRPLGT